MPRALTRRAWTAAALAAGHETIAPPTANFGTLATPNVLPAGSTITIELQNDQFGNVSEVIFELQPNGKRITTPLTGQPLRGGGTSTTADLAPIVTFTLLLVGSEDSVHAHLLSGAGSIIYNANGNKTLVPLPQLPVGVAEGESTAKLANSTYSKIPFGPSDIFAQQFQVDPSTFS